jgi:hypothetical protein
MAPHRCGPPRHPVRRIVPKVAAEVSAARDAYFFASQFARAMESSGERSRRVSAGGSSK